VDEFPQHDDMMTRAGDISNTHYFPITASRHDTENLAIENSSAQCPAVDLASAIKLSVSFSRCPRNCILCRYKEMPPQRGFHISVKFRGCQQNRKCPSPLSAGRNEALDLHDDPRFSRRTAREVCPVESESKEFPFRIFNHTIWPEHLKYILLRC
jgi:hypothetical protein